MFLVLYNELQSSHDCWGKHETFKKFTVKEFSTITAWLAFKSENPVEFLSMYKVTHRIDETEIKEFN